ncbi:MAG: hypothetical protein QXL47_00380 [Candidatus Anstonellales archaeon]
MKKICWVMVGIGIIAGSIFGGKELYKKIQLKEEIKRAETVLDSLPEKKYIYVFPKNKLHLDDLRVVVFDFNKEAKEFLKTCSKEYLTATLEKPDNYDAEFFSKAFSYYLWKEGIYGFPISWDDYSDNPDTLWVELAIRGERIWSCYNSSSLIASLYDIFGDTTSTVVVFPVDTSRYKKYGTSPLHAMVLVRGDSLVESNCSNSEGICRVEQLKYVLIGEKIVK